jgi:hypothetical protein
LLSLSYCGTDVSAPVVVVGVDTGRTSVPRRVDGDGHGALPLPEAVALLERAAASGGHDDDDVGTTKAAALPAPNRPPALTVDDDVRQSNVAAIFLPDLREAILPPRPDNRL